jgi:hypothetical protein
MQAVITDIDPFDLPEWLGTHDVVWRSDTGLRAGHLVRGRLTADGEADVVCDLLAVDEAYPESVTDDASRLRVHQSWRHGQILVGRYVDRLVLAAPGTRFDADLAIQAIERFARAVGADRSRFSLLLRP